MLISIFVVFGIVGGCSGSADETTSTSSTTSTSTSVPVSSSTTSTTTSTTSSTSTTLALRPGLIEAPDSWTETGPNQFEIPAIAGGLAPTMVTAEAVATVADLEEVVASAKNARAEIVRDFEVLSEGARTLGSYPARFLEYAGVDQGNIARYELWIDHDDGLIHIVYSASLEAYTAGKAEFETTLVNSMS